MDKALELLASYQSQILDVITGLCASVAVIFLSLLGLAMLRWAYWKIIRMYGWVTEDRNTLDAYGLNRRDFWRA